MNPEHNPNPEQVEQNPKAQKFLNHYFFICIIILVVVSFLGALSDPLILDSHRNPNRTQAINNAKQIGLALLAFEDEYSTFPNDMTAKDFIENHPSYQQDLAGTSANAMLRQLILNSENGRSEDMFKLTDYDIPDGNIAPGEILKKGEISFAYISDQSSANNPSRAIILAPLIPGTKKFDPKPFDGRAIVIKIDNSAGIYKIHEDGTIHDKDGDILSPKHPFWNGKTPTIHYPE